MSAGGYVRIPYGIVQIGTEWLYARVQPDTALVEPRGVRFSLSRHGIRFLPTAAAGRPLVVLEVDVRQWVMPAGKKGEWILGGNLFDDGTTITAKCTRPSLSDPDISEVIASLNSLGVCTTETHNHGLTATIALARPAHPSLLAAVERWSAGCPHHRGSQVCDAPVSAHGQACSWRSTGRQAAIWPGTPNHYYESLMMEPAPAW